MILDLFMCECMQHLFPIFIIWKERMPMTYSAYVCQFNKHLLTNHNKGIVLLIGLRWLDTVFQDQYLPSLSINYVAINKVLEKLPPQLY